MGVLFTFVTSLMDADSESAKQLEASLTNEGNGEYFGWQKLSRRIEFESGVKVDQVYFAGYERNSANFPEQLYSAYLKAYDSAAAITWMSDEGDKGIFPNQYEEFPENAI